MSLFDIFRKNDPYKHSRELVDDILSYALHVNCDREREKKSKKWAYDKITEYALPKINGISAYGLANNLSIYLSGSSECPPLKMLLLDEVEERIRTGNIPKRDIDLVARKSGYEIWCFNPLLSELDIPCKHKKEFSESKFSVCKDTCQHGYPCLCGNQFRCQCLKDSQEHQNNIMDIYNRFRKFITENRYFVYSDEYREDIGEYAFKQEMAERRSNAYKALEGYVKDIHAYLVKNNSELKIGHLDYLCDIFFVENDDLPEKPYILVPLGLEVLDYIKERDEKRYDKIFKEKREIIRDYYFNP